MYVTKVDPSAQKDPFQPPTAIFRPPGGHLGFCSLGGVVGGEQVPQVSLG